MRVFAASPLPQPQPASTAGRLPPPNRLVCVVLFFEIVLVLTVVVISWFALYTLYRLITDES